MENYASYYETARIAERAQATEEMRTAWTDLVAWEEDLFAYGPALDVVQQHFADAGFLHIEMFKALPDMQQTLIKEREMENRYLAELARPQNLIFERDQGAAWDSFTIGTTSNTSLKAPISRWRPRMPPPKRRGSRACTLFRPICVYSSRCTTRYPGKHRSVRRYNAFSIQALMLHLPHVSLETP
jgi:hypothetical protein